LDIAIWVVAGALSIYAAIGFFKAGKFKATASRETLLGAGFGWIEKIPFALVRLIAWLEILGGIGLLGFPIVYLFGVEWAIWLAVAAGLGLALTMVGAIIVHAARGESKYTLKMNVRLLGLAALSAGLWALLPLI
jgi:hypothetical protein